MIHKLDIKNTGPSANFPEIEFGTRLNVITGDNGLGKSFLLDIVWWALTRKWPREVNPGITSGYKVLPSPSGEAEIAFTFDSVTTQKIYSSEWDSENRIWKGRPGRPASPGLVIYAQVDGSFAIWDPHRNYWKQIDGIDQQDRPPAYVFSAHEVWNGQQGPGESKTCRGLIEDWSTWQGEKGDAFEKLSQVLKTLSPGDSEPLIPGERTRIDLDDVRPMPTLKMPYGQDVPVVHVSAGMRRIIALSYLLIWAWKEHEQAARLLNKPTTSQVIFLVDEIEAHLHPKWQRRIIPALLEVVKTLVDPASVQIIATTHSPLVMTSIESRFDPALDRWLDLDLVQNGESGDSSVTLESRPLFHYGDANRWLTGNAFDLKYPVSEELESVLTQVESMMRNTESIDRTKWFEMDSRLKEMLSESDPFWIRWRYFFDKQGWQR